MLRINFLCILRKSVNFSVILSSKRKMNSTNVFPLAIAAYEICRRARLRLLPLRIHTLRCNVLRVHTLAMQNLSFIWIAGQLLALTTEAVWPAEKYTPIQLSLRAVKHKTKLYLELSIFFCAGTMTSSVNARANQNVNNIWLADATHPSRRTTFLRCEHVTFLISPMER